MLSIHRYKQILFILATTAMLAAGCKKDNIAPPVDRTAQPRTLGEFIENNYDLSIFAAALKKAGLMDSLKLPGALTCFAPDNRAFNEIGIAGMADIEKMNTDSLRAAIRYHFIRDRYFISGFPLQLNNAYTTLSGRQMTVAVSVGATIEERNVCVNGAYVMDGSKRNIALGNGVLHIILKPLQYNEVTIQDYITSRPDLSLFAAAMKKFNYWDRLKTDAKLTIFAPNNNAFEASGITAEKISQMDPALYKELALGVYPLLFRSTVIFSTDGSQISGTLYRENGIVLQTYSIAPNFSYSTWSNTYTSAISIYNNQSGIWYPNDAGPVAVDYAGGYARGADHLTQNGIVHIIDALIFEPERMRK